MRKKQTRREVLKKTGAAVGSLAAGVLTLDLSQVLAQQTRPGTRPLILKIKVPSNLKVEARIQPDTRALNLQAPPRADLMSVKPIEATMDLTSQKTAEWINKLATGTTSNGCTCCVRG